MSTIEVTDTHVEIHFTWGERIAGMVRDQRFPRSAITAVELVHDPISATKGLRAPGLGLPGRRKIGTWRRPGHRELVCVRKGEPAVRLELRGERYDAALIGTPDAATVVDRLAARG